MKTDLKILDITRAFGIGLCLIAAGMTAMLCAGCITTRTPAGESTTSLDLDTTIALTQLTLTVTEQAFDMWLRYEAAQSTLDAQQLLAETTARRERIEQLTAALAALYEARAKQ